MATRESSQKGGGGWNKAKGRGFHRETVEKGLDGKDKKGGIRTSDKEMQREQQR